MDKAGKTNRSHWIKAGTIIPTASIEEVLQVVSDVTGVTIEDMKGKKRTREVVDSRHMFFFICKRHAVQSLEIIGRTIGKHHSTVVHGHQKTQDLIDTKDKTIINQIAEIRKQLGITKKTIKDVKSIS